MMQKLKDWYRHPGFFQFLLGNELHRKDAPLLFFFCWFILSIGVILPAIWFLQLALRGFPE
jgi:hypothetical protein